MQALQVWPLKLSSKGGVCTCKGGDDIHYQAASLILGKKKHIIEKPTKNDQSLNLVTFEALLCTLNVLPSAPHTT